MGRGNGVLRPLRVLAVVALLGATSCSGQTPTSTGDLGSDVLDLAPVPAANELVDIVPTPTPEGPRPIIVVTLLGETGVMAQLDGPALAGVVAEIDRLNDAGGVLGRSIELRRFDTNSRVSVMERTMSRLVEEAPDLVIVSCDVDFSKPALEIADAVGLVTISPCADDALYATGAWGARNFTFGAPGGERGALAAVQALERYGSTAIVLRDVTSPEALEFCDGFERAFVGLGGTVSYKDEFSYDTLEPIQDRLSDQAPQTSFIVLCSHVPGGIDAAPSVIAMLRTIGFQAPVVSGLSVDEPTWFQAVPVLGELMFVSWSSVHGNDPDDGINDLIRRANANRRTPPAGVTTVLGAESIEAWARAAATVRSVEPGPIAAALGAFNDEAFATGEISFAGGARMDIGRAYRVLRVFEGQVTVTDVVDVEG